MARSLLRQVLDHFENSQKPLRLTVLAEELNISDGMLNEMIQYWVKKGKLREISIDSGVCYKCGTQSVCPLVVSMPRMYEIVTDDDPPVTPCCCK